MGSFFASCSDDSANISIAAVTAPEKAMELGIKIPNEEIKVSKKEEVKMETTLIILKPDCMEKGLVGEVISRFCKEESEIIGCKMMTLSENV
ncbi:MAG: hypothetical protein LBB05_00345, partial [Puniceicoccales bacterium]|nr:hypothetical protein [Puniceicoccales bacterium]